MVDDKEAYIMRAMRKSSLIVFPGGPYSRVGPRQPASMSSKRLKTGDILGLSVMFSGVKLIL